jgi:hypothetical protein
MGCESLHDPRSVHLPPPDAWKVNLEKLEKFYAPTDDRGFVMPDATIEVMLGRLTLKTAGWRPIFIIFSMMKHFTTQ